MAFAVKLICITNDLFFDGFGQKVLLGIEKSSLDDGLSCEACAGVAFADAC